jgi:MtN3 and saliva related transmembrane protein
MAAHLLINAIGTLAAAGSMASFIPQAAKIIREHDATSVSLRMYVVTRVGFSLWSAYGVLLKSWPLIAANLVCLSLASFILVLKLRDRSPADTESTPS